MTTRGITLFLAIAAVAVAAAAPRPLHLKGKTLVDDRGKPVVLRGVNAASLEWTSDGEGHILETVRVAIEDWKSNVVRIPLSQDRWFGAGPEQKDKGVSYRALVKQVVDAASDRNAYVILDLHWNTGGLWGQGIGQHKMPDQHSLVFWRDVARTYKNHPAVLFDLYNETHDVSWDVWRNGGEVTERTVRPAGEIKYRAVGMQPLLDEVRKTGARNVAVVGGLDWAYDLKGVLGGKGLKDPNGNGIIYVCHSYPFKGDTLEQWAAKMRKYTAELAVLVGEFGSGPFAQKDVTGKQWVEGTLKVIAETGAHWTAWDLHPSAGPTLISDWKYTPTPGFGDLVKAELAKYAGR